MIATAKRHSIFFIVALLVNIYTGFKIFAKILFFSETNKYYLRVEWYFHVGFFAAYQWKLFLFLQPYLPIWFF